MRGSRNFVTSTSSSGFSRTSTAASTPQVVSVRVHRKRSSSPPIGDGHSMSGLYYRTVVAPSSDCWDMLSSFSDCHLVGKGSYGEVVRANSTLADHGLVAIKRVDILEENQVSDWENGLRLLREIFFLRNLRHPNLISLISVFPNNPVGARFTSVCIVTPFFKEGSLSSYEPRSLKEILGIKLKLMNGLKFLHACKIIHRDIKRENIFIHKFPNSTVPKVVIGDFGLSRSVRPGMTSEVVTKPYRCPSLLLGETNYGAEVDVFAAGIVLLEMLSGKTNATLLPNRKMGLKNFLRFQVALTSVSYLGDRMLDLANKMHVDLQELASDVEQGTDFDDKLASEWGRQAWSCISDIYSPGTETLNLAKGMIAFDPTQRWSVDKVINDSVFDPVRKYLELDSGTPPNGVTENYDEEISLLESDSAKAAAVKAAIWELIQEDPLVGTQTNGKPVSHVFEQEVDDQPVSKRTRLQLNRQL